MSYRVSKTELIFENLESVIIEGEHIKDIGMCAVTDMVHIKENAVHFEENASSFFVNISEEGNLEYIPRNGDEKSTVFERIMKYRDICNVKLVLEEVRTGKITEKTYNVPWDGTCDENFRQRVIFEGGDLTVHIE